MKSVVYELKRYCGIYSEGGRLAAHSKRESDNSLFDAGRQWAAMHTGVEKLLLTT